MSLALKLFLSPLLVTQALRARARVPRMPEAAGPRHGVAGDGAACLRLLIAGDSSAAGVGVRSQGDALAGQLVRELARRCGAQVHWQLVARSGVTSEQAFDLLQQAMPVTADIAVLVTGVNDVVDQVPSRRAVAARERIANALRNGTGVRHVVFCPLPPIHQFPALPQPLRWMAGADARRHNTALREWAGARADELGDVSCVPIDDVQLNRGVMAADGFHPGEPVYRQIAVDMARHIATSVWPRLSRALP
jgi:lysophospholipase L1-like esterase